MLLYIHRLLQNLKTVARRYDVKMVCSAPNKLSTICKIVNNFVNFVREKHMCRVKRGNIYVPCNHCMHCIPLSCGWVYVGETGMCINVRLQEHERYLDIGRGCNLSAYYKGCEGC